jgi:hypothetical protein
MTKIAIPNSNYSMGVVVGYWIPNQLDSLSGPKIVLLGLYADENTSNSCLK